MKEQLVKKLEEALVALLVKIDKDSTLSKRDYGLLTEAVKIWFQIEALKKA